MTGEKNFDFDFNFNYESGKEETLERIEKQCDRMAAPPPPAYRETKEILWGFYKSETINCPEPQSQNEESEEDEDYQRAKTRSTYERKITLRNCCRSLEGRVALLQFGHP